MNRWWRLESTLPSLPVLGFTCICCSVYSVFIVPTGSLRLPWLRFSVLFPQLQGKCQRITRKDGARPALFPFSELCCSMYRLCRLCCSMYCLCVNVYCTTATGCQPLQLTNISYIVSFNNWPLKQKCKIEERRRVLVQVIRVGTTPFSHTLTTYQINI
jgi:hypothetical protein